MSYALPVVVALVLWWLTTVLLLRRLQLPDETFSRTLVAVSVLLGAGLFGFAISLGDATPRGAYIAFASALTVWGWHEAMYFLGYLSGPRPGPCPYDARLSMRFRFGVQASLYHEIAVILTGVAMLWLSRDAANTVAAQAFTVLWLMRWSSKLNIFFGVSNLHEEFWPRHLHYLSSYVTHARGNWVFPFSMLLALALAVWVSQPLRLALIEPFDITACALVLTLLALACLEHVLLLLPVPDKWLWQWGLIEQAPAARVSRRASLSRDGQTPIIGGHEKPSGGV
ncbi:MAG: putative photosynthetic complex assembly protein PuhE [Pseudomonadota bacterium]